MHVCRPCLHASSQGRQRPRERGQPELAGWVMNLLLRHSLKHNYTHPDQEGSSRPLTSSSNKSRAKKTQWLHSPTRGPSHSNRYKPHDHLLCLFLSLARVQTICQSFCMQKLLTETALKYAKVKFKHRRSVYLLQPCSVSEAW